MKRNKFSLSNTVLMSANMGWLYPVGLWEVLPGDTFQHASSMLLRCSPLLAPVMHPVDVRLHCFFVPNRLVWDEWEDFITGGPDGLDMSVYPTRKFGPGFNPAPQPGGLSDFFGIPPGTVGEVSVLPYRAYWMIWNEYYRDQDLQAELDFPKSSGVDTTNYTVQFINWEKDYLTTARPWPQKGPSVSVPAQVTGIAAAGATIAAAAPFYGTTTAGDIAAGAPYFQAATLGVKAPGAGTASTTFRPQVTANVEINQLREAFAIQRWEEARARYGSRYTEYLRYLGVRSSDARLQRPEYLGGGRSTIQFSEVLQTAEGTSPVGELRGHGITGLRSYRYRRFFEEHGLVMCLLSVRPKAIYMQGIDRIFNKRVREDYWQKEFEHIGEQEVLNKEVHAGHGIPDGTWGYQPRYEEYRRRRSEVCGEFRSSLLNFWHMAREFVSPPALNSDFVRCTPTERIFAVPSQDVLYAMLRHSVQARRLVGRSTHSHVF